MMKILVTALLLSLAAVPALADMTHKHTMPMKVGDLTVEAPFARATPGRAKNGAAFLLLRNGGATADRLVGATSDVATRTELHTHMHVDGVMKMRKVDGIDVPAGGMAMLEPGGDHVMLMGLKAPLKEGDKFPLTLMFEKAGEITVHVKIGKVGAKGMSHDMHKKTPKPN